MSQKLKRLTKFIKAESKILRKRFNRLRPKRNGGHVSADLFRVETALGCHGNKTQMQALHGQFNIRRRRVSPMIGAVR